MATTLVTTTDILDIEDALGEFVADFDLDGLRAAYRDAIQDLLPAGVTLAMNGEVFAEVVEIDPSIEDTDEDSYAVQRAIEATPAGLARAIVWSEIATDVDFGGLCERHLTAEQKD